MVISCPNDKTHKVFDVIAHVSEEWHVDETGEFIKQVRTLEVIHQPEIRDLFTCVVCGAQAGAREGS